MEFNGSKFNEKLYRAGDMLDSPLKGMHLVICRDEIVEIRVLLVFLFLKILLVCCVCFPLYKPSLLKLPFTKLEQGLFLDAKSITQVEVRDVLKVLL